MASGFRVAVGAMEILPSCYAELEGEETCGSPVLNDKKLSARPGCLPGGGRPDGRPVAEISWRWWAWVSRRAAGRPRLESLACICAC